MKQVFRSSSSANEILPKNENNPNLIKIRHTAAHILAMSVQNLFPDAKTAIGPWTENG